MIEGISESCRLTEHSGTVFKWDYARCRLVAYAGYVVCQKFVITVGGGGGG